MNRGAPAGVDVDPDPSDDAFTAAGRPPVTLSRRLRYALRRYPLHLQPELTDCGPACLAMIAEYHGRTTPIARLRELVGVSRDGSSLFGVAEAAEALGIRARGVEADFDDLRSIALPAIAHVGAGHFVVVYEASAKDVLIADPATGLERVPREAFARRWQGRLLLLAPAAGPAQVVPGTAPPSGLGRFASYLRPHAGVFAEVFVAAIVLDILALVLPLASQAVIDRVLPHGAASLLDALLIACLGAALFAAFIRGIRVLLLYDAVRAVDRAVAADFHHHLFRLPLQFFASRRVGDVLLRFSDNRKVRGFLVSTAMGTAMDFVFSVIYLTVIAIYDIRLAAVSLAIIATIVLLTAATAPALRRFGREVAQGSADLQSALVESLSAVSTVKALRGEASERRRFEALLERQLSAERRQVRLSTFAEVIAGFVIAAGHALVLYWGAARILDGGMTVGRLVAVMALLALVTGPAFRLVGAWQQFLEMAVSLERLADVFDARPEEPDEARLLDLPPLAGHLRMQNVSFRYERDLEPALDGLSLEIFPGERVAVVGRSGAGKTTLVHLILKLYEPTEGSITIDDHDLRTVSARSLRSQVSFVPQRIDLLSGTVGENIAFGRDLSQAEIVAAARAAAAHDFITRLPLGYATPVGERGTARLSGGELQRIAIARAVAGAPRLLLLDEPTSALDAEGEAALLRSIESSGAGRTTIVLAHRLGFARRADRIVVLDRGRLIEQGTHDELVARGGLYASLWKESTG